MGHPGLDVQKLTSHQPSGLSCCGDTLFPAPELVLAGAQWCHQVSESYTATHKHPASNCMPRRHGHLLILYSQKRKPSSRPQLCRRSLAPVLTPVADPTSDPCPLWQSESWPCPHCSPQQPATHHLSPRSQLQVSAHLLHRITFLE